MSDNIVRVNNKKDSELSFEVTIQGVSAETPDDLLRCRFVVEGPSFDISLPCQRVADTENRWSVVVPPMSFLSGDTHGFRLEMVVDGYYFEPAAGNIIFVAEPEVNMKPDSKPKVTVTFAPTAEDEKAEDKDEKKEEEKKKEPVKKEEPKKEVKKEEKKDEKKDEKKETKESADDLAKRIVTETVGKTVSKPEKDGFLFSRNKSGKKQVRGLVDPQQQKEAEERSAKIKKILGS